MFRPSPVPIGRGAQVCNAPKLYRQPSSVNRCKASLQELYVDCSTRRNGRKIGWRSGNRRVAGREVQNDGRSSPKYAWIRLSARLMHRAGSGRVSRIEHIDRCPFGAPVSDCVRRNELRSRVGISRIRRGVGCLSCTPDLGSGHWSVTSAGVRRFFPLFFHRTAVCFWSDSPILLGVRLCPPGRRRSMWSYRTVARGRMMPGKW